MDEQKTNWRWTFDVARAEIDGFWIEAHRNGFWVGNDKTEDLFVWAKNDSGACNLLSETWELKIGSGATDDIPDETWDRIVRAVAELRANKT